MEGVQPLLRVAAQPLLVANWKSHGRLKQNQRWAARLLAQSASSRVERVVCPPFPYVAQLRELFKDSSVAIGCQNVSAYPPGAYTGEVAAEMLHDLGCRYVIIGHSERRALCAESDQQIAQKLQRAVECDLLPILCIGETLAQREDGQTEAVLSQQLSLAVPVLKAKAFVLAYEPIWAIGTGQTATPAQAQQVHRFLRAHLSHQLDAGAAALRILYGGSVKPENAAGLFAERDIAGGLVGGASLNSEDFLLIARGLEEAKRPLHSEN